MTMTAREYQPLRVGTPERRVRTRLQRMLQQAPNPPLGAGGEKRAKFNGAQQPRPPQREAVTVRQRKARGVSFARAAADQSPDAWLDEWVASTREVIASAHSFSRDELVTALRSQELFMERESAEERVASSSGASAAAAWAVETYASMSLSGKQLLTFDELLGEEHAILAPRGFSFLAYGCRAI